MKGAIAKIFDIEEREKMVEEVLLTWCKILPFLPSSTLEWAAHKLIDWCAKHMETALQSSFEDFNNLRKEEMKALKLMEGQTSAEMTIHPGGTEEDREDTIAYEHCLIAHLVENLMADVENVPLFDHTKKNIVKRLAQFIVANSCDFEKLESIFHFLHNDGSGEI